MDDTLLPVENVIETERLALRRPLESDAALQWRVLNSPQVMAHIGGPKTLDEIRAKHVKTRECFARDGFGFMMMIEKASGELVGHCGMKRVDNPLARNQGDHEIGWLVREDRWRRGYAEEAMRAVLAWAFDDIGAPFVVALTSERNEPSWTLMRKLGMIRCADLDFFDPAFADEDNPTILYRLAQDEWRAP